MKQRTLVPFVGVVAIGLVLVGCLWPGEPRGPVNGAVMAAGSPAAGSGDYPLPEVPAGPLEVHPSQKRVNGPCFFIEISQARFVTPENPRGWAHPFYNELPRKGWSILLGTMMQAQEAGYTSVWLWEPAGQYEGIGGCMAWFSEKTISDSWSQKMKDSFGAFVRTVRDRLKMEVVIYSGCANHVNIGTTLHPDARDVTVNEIPHVLEAMRYIASLGAMGVGMDGFALLQEKDPQTAMRVIAAIRADDLAKDLMLACEGWPVPNMSQAYIQQQMVSLDLIRGGHSTQEALFAKFVKRVDVARETARVPERRGVWLLHGSNWKEAEAARAYALIKQYGMIPMDYLMDRPRKYWRNP